MVKLVRKPGESENSIQVALVEYVWLKHKLTLQHCPNQLVGQLSTGSIIFYKKMGVRVGWPDLCLPEPRGQYHGLYLEQKAKRKKPTPEQYFWLQYLNDRGYYACWTDSFEKSVKEIEKYLLLGDYKAIEKIS